MIWVSCDGENSADREHIGNVTYTPFRGFPAYYFPYKNVPGYLSPIVALQFQKPEGMFLVKLLIFVDWKSQLNPHFVFLLQPAFLSTSNAKSGPRTSFTIASAVLDRFTLSS